MSKTAYYIAPASFLQWSATLPCVQTWKFSTPPLFSRLDGTLRQADEPDLALLLASFLLVHQALVDGGVLRYMDLSDLDDAPFRSKSLLEFIVPDHFVCKTRLFSSWLDFQAERFIQRFRCR